MAALPFGTLATLALRHHVPRPPPHPHCKPTVMQFSSETSSLRSPAPFGRLRRPSARALATSRGARFRPLVVGVGFPSFGSWHLRTTFCADHTRVFGGSCRGNGRIDWRPLLPLCAASSWPPAALTACGAIIPPPVTRVRGASRACTFVGLRPQTPKTAKTAVFVIHTQVRKLIFVKSVNSHFAYFVNTRLHLAFLRMLTKC